MHRETLKTVALTLLAVFILLGLWSGYQAIRRDAQPGRDALAYINTLIYLGKLPSGEQVAAMVQQAQAGPPATAPAPEAKQPEGK